MFLTFLQYLNAAISHGDLLAGIRSRLSDCVKITLLTAVASCASNSPPLLITFFSLRLVGLIHQAGTVTVIFFRDAQLRCGSYHAELMCELLI